MDREEQELRASQIATFAIECAKFAQHLRGQLEGENDLDRLLRHVFRIRRSISKLPFHDSLKLSDHLRSLDDNWKDLVFEFIRQNEQIKDEEIRAKVLEILLSE